MQAKPNRRIAGIQPGYLPWLGYFDQMLAVDTFVIADEMAFSSGGWAHRNRVRGRDGAHWLTLPARPRGGQRIDEVSLDAEVPWTRKHLRTLRHFYSSSPHARSVLEELEHAFDVSATRLVEATIPIIRLMARMLGIDTEIVVSSELGLEAAYRRRFPEQPGATHRIVAYMHELGADELLEGETGRAYLDLELCRGHDIEVVFHEYRHPAYAQLHSPFISHLSALDLLLCAGPREARRVLREHSRRAA